MPLSVALCLVGAAATARAEDAAPENVADALAGDGVTVQTVCTNCNNADLSLGGLGNDFVPITCDELPVTTGLAQIYLLSVMPATMIDKIAVARARVRRARGSQPVGGGITIERSTPKPGVQVNASADAGAFGWVGLAPTSRADKTGSAARSRAPTPRPTRSTRTATRIPTCRSFDRRTLEGHAGSHRPSTTSCAWAPPTTSSIRRTARRRSTSSAIRDPSNTSGEIKYNNENVDLARRQYDLVYEGATADGSKLVGRGPLRGAVRGHRREPPLGTPVAFPTYKIDEKDTAGTFAWSRPGRHRVEAPRRGLLMSRDYAVIDLLSTCFGMRPRLPALTEQRSTELGAWGSF